MALAGVGVDIVEIARMKRAMEKNPAFIRRAFTDDERAYCERSGRAAEHYAARFAAREAVLKALGTGFSRGIRPQDVSVARTDAGRPVAVLTGRAAEIAAEQGVQEIALSLSFTREVAIANAVAVTEEVRPKPDERKTAAQELAASFKEARSVIDELERVQDELTGAAHAVTEDEDGQPAADVAQPELPLGE